MFIRILTHFSARIEIFYYLPMDGIYESEIVFLSKIIHKHIIKTEIAIETPCTIRLNAIDTFEKVKC